MEPLKDFWQGREVSKFILDKFIHHVFGIYFGNLRLEGGWTGNDTGLISLRHIKPVESKDVNDWLRVRVSGELRMTLRGPGLGNWQIVVLGAKMYNTQGSVHLAGGFGKVYICYFDFSLPVVSIFSLGRIWSLDWTPDPCKPL